MVSKTSVAADTAKKSVAPAAKKSVSKSKAKKTSVTTKKPVKAKPAAKPVEAKVSVAPVEKVLEIKAKNEDKKASKAVKTTKVVEEKTCPCCNGKCKDGICASWVRTYSNMFNFKGRTSRYEFWGFNLLNIFFAILMLFAFNDMITHSPNNIITAIGLGGMFAFIAIEVIAYLSLIVRRLHDTGNRAWKGFFRPIIISFLLFILLAIGCVIIIQKLGENLFTLDLTMQLCLLAYLLLFLIVAIFLMYYGVKTTIISGFFDEDEDNIYGEAHYADKFYKLKAFKYAVLFYTFVPIIEIVMESITGYMKYGQY